MGQLQKIESKLKAIGYQIIAVSADRAAKLKEMIGRHQLTYQLVSDSTMSAARAFGLAYRVSPEMRQKYRNFGIDLAAASGQDHGLLPVPAVYLINRRGRIDFVYANPDYRRRLDPDLLLAAARVAQKQKGAP